jgi:hypothetical protein
MNKGVRRLAAVGAAGAAAMALGAGSAVGATTSPVHTAQDALIPKCPASSLAVWVNVDAGSGAAGSVYYPLEFTNVSSSTCYLDGFPGVSAIRANGTQLGSAAARDNTEPARIVNVAPGQTAHATLRYGSAEVATSGCKPAAAAFIKVFPPDQTGHRTGFFSLPSCTVSGHIYLTIRRIQPGT